MRKLPPLPKLREIVKLYGLTAKEKLSQNFLFDLNITNKIVKSARGVSNKTILEVGPGPGSLTRSIIADGCNKLVVVEKDARFSSALNMIKDNVKEYGVDMNIEIADILDVDEKNLLMNIGAQPVKWEEESNVKLIGNLPFSVSTALALKWMKMIYKRTGPFYFGRSPMTLLFQKEVAERIVASPSTKDYGRLSIMVQHLCHAEILFNISSKSFVPAPDVTGTVVYLEPRKAPLIDVDILALEDLLRKVFTQRRKILSNAITTIHPEAKVLLEMCGMDEKKRPEDFPVETWCLLANIYKSSRFYPNNTIKID